MPSSTTSVRVNVSAWVDVGPYGEDWNIKEMRVQAEREALEKIRLASQKVPGIEFEAAVIASKIVTTVKP